MADVKIQRIDVYQVNLPYAGGTYRLSGGREYTTFDATIVKIAASNGIQGWGESTPFGSTYVASHGRGVRAAIAEIAPHIIGLDPRRVDRINDSMDSALAGHLDAKTALDVACWDILGKAAGLPVCDLLGGSTEIDLPLISSIGVSDPKDMKATVADFRAKGYKGHSIKIAGDDPELDAQRISQSLADKKPGEFFLVDANGGLTVESALRMTRLLSSRLDFVLEAPCSTARECSSLRRRTSIPIIYDELATDEVSIIRLVAEDAAEGIGFKVSKNGGLTRGRRQRDICLSAGYSFSVQDTVGSDIAFAAIVHLAQTVPEKNLRCVLGTPDMITTKTADLAFEVRNGHVKASNTPGLGVTPRLETLGGPVASYE